MRISRTSFTDFPCKLEHWMEVIDETGKAQCRREPLRAPGGRVDKLVDPFQEKINFINLLTIGEISKIFMATISRYCTNVSTYEHQK